MTWAALSSDYAAWKARNYPGKPILQREGDLYESLTGRGDVRVTEDELVILGADHGRFHQSGTRRMPRRRPVELTERDRREWSKKLQRHIAGGARGGLAGLEGIL